MRLGQDRVLVASLGPFRLREPVRVVAVGDEPARRGFAYGTRDGHPVAGEEAFTVHRSPDGEVWFTLRSITRPWALARAVPSGIAGAALVPPPLPACSPRPGLTGRDPSVGIPGPRRAAALVVRQRARRGSNGCAMNYPTSAGRTRQQAYI